ncbi:hypothetical protein LEMLEM_LOCUS21310, partial [Lemmus lemmus]
MKRMLAKAPVMLPSLSRTQEEYRSNRPRVNLRDKDAGFLLFQKPSHLEGETIGGVPHRENPNHQDDYNQSEPLRLLPVKPSGRRPQWWIRHAHQSEV